MCTGSDSALNIFGDKNPLGKLNRQIDPGSAALWNKDAKQLDSLHLLGKLKPKIPDPPPTPTRPQDAKAPDTTPLRRRNGAGGVALPGGSTMLTGPSGVTNAQMNLGTSSLLGGS